MSRRKESVIDKRRESHSPVLGSGAVFSVKSPITKKTTSRNVERPREYFPTSSPRASPLTDVSVGTVGLPRFSNFYAMIVKIGFDLFDRISAIMNHRSDQGGVGLSRCQNVFEVFGAACAAGGDNGNRYVF